MEEESGEPTLATPVAASSPAMTTLFTSTNSDDPPIALASPSVNACLNGKLNGSIDEALVKAKKGEEGSDVLIQELIGGSNTAALKYLQLVERLRQHWTDRPDVYIHYEQLAYTLRVPIVEISTPSFLSAGFHGIVNLVKKLDVTGYLRKHDRSVNLHALAPCAGRIVPGKMTLVLAPPGHGKSTYLKTLAGRLIGDSHSSGTLLYNGLTPAEVKSNGVNLRKLLAYVSQVDQHFPVLTVQETLDFAAQNACASTAIFQDEQLDQIERERATRLIHLLGLEEAQNTIIGNDLLRGISGGQRKRVTIGEMLVTNARVFLLDEVSTGLDSAITYHIFNALRAICHSQNSSVVTALLQPTPETYELFDEVIMMRDGEIVYHGDRTQLKAYFRSVLGFPIPSDEDEAGFVVDYLTNPSVLMESQKRKQERALARQQKSDKERKVREKRTVEADTSAEEQKEMPESNEHMMSLGDDDASPPKNMVIQDAPVTVATETEEIVHRYRNSDVYTELMMDAGASRKIISADPTRYILDRTAWSEFSRRQFAQSTPHSPSHHLKLAMGRQAKLFWRNKQVMIPRVFQATLMGIVYGTLFYNLSLSDFQSHLGLILYLVMFGAFSNLSELPVAAEARAVVVKQLDASFFPAIPYVFSVVVLGIPIAVVETLIFGTLMYFLPAFTYDAGRFFFYLLLLFVSSLAMGTFFRTISYSTPNPDVARQLDFPFIVLFVIFGGFLIPYNEVPDWLIWVYWISPLSWGVRSIAQNEYQASRYNSLINITGTDGVEERLGNYYLGFYDLSTNYDYKWAGVGYLLGFFLTFLLISSFTISYIRSGGQLGTRRLPPLDKKAANEKVKEEDLVVNRSDETAQAPPVDTGIGAAMSSVASDVGAPIGGALNDKESTMAQPVLAMSVQRNVGTHVSIPIAIQPKKGMSSQAKSSFHMTGMPFTPVALAWRNIHYYVDVGKGKNKIEKHLLRGINGFSKPGTLTALMGSSGAGKTTLMDVIAGRKTTGRITGDILVNGRPKDTESFNHLTGYVEQQDIHMGLHTVREALEFSARIRLPVSVSPAQRENWINEVMALVGLSRISHRILGDVAIPGLSPGQMKLVTIAVELVANPSVLFLDEPTSGLDAPSAFRIMKAVSRIAQTGRSVLCTIHQPSFELFCMFDRLLLLRSGGEEVFFSDLGLHASHLVDFFENESMSKNPPRLPLGQNPANFMLDVIGAGVHSDEGGAIAALDFEAADWHALWMKSKLHSQVMNDLEWISNPANAGVDAAQVVLDQPYVGLVTRYYEVQKRYFVMHWRNVPTNLSRIVLMLSMGILLGLIYLQINQTTFSGLTSFISVIFLGISFPASVSAASAFPSFFRQRAVYYRETTIGMYNFWIYSIAMTIVELPYIFFALAFFIIPFYFLVGLKNNGTLFFKFYLVVYCQALVYSFLSQLWMALCPSQISSNILNGLFMSLFFMFGGLFITKSAMPSGWTWFYYIDPIPKTFNAAIMPQVYCNNESNPNCPKILVPQTNGASVSQYTYDYVSNLIEATNSEYWPNIGYLIATMTIIRILNLLALRFISHIKR